MTILLIDLGNTALKWCRLGGEDEPHTVVHRGESDFKKKLYASWLNENPAKVIGCSVAAPEIAFSATKFFNDHSIKWNWVKAQTEFRSKSFSLKNCYKKTTALGVDRWNACIGAVAFSKEQAALLNEKPSSVIVVQTGTATTVDFVLSRGSDCYEFLGGKIAPGPTMMREGLFSIPSLSNRFGAYESFPASTADAVASGIIDTQIGLIAISFNQLREMDPSVKIILAGGAAKFIAPHLKKYKPALMIRHNLVLRGLAERAKQEEEQCSNI